MRACVCACVRACVCVCVCVCVRARARSCLSERKKKKGEGIETSLLPIYTIRPLFIIFFVSRNIKTPKATRPGEKKFWPKKEILRLPTSSSSSGDRVLAEGASKLKKMAFAICWWSSTSILSLVFADEAVNGGKSQWSLIGPAFVELRAMTQTSKA